MYLLSDSIGLAFGKCASLASGVGEELLPSVLFLESATNNEPTEENLRGMIVMTASNSFEQANFGTANMQAITTPRATSAQVQRHNQASW
jgi:hypothetical protein